jgi:L-malate glycosyltransferase
MKRILHLQNELNIACGVSKNIFLIIKYSPKEYEHFVLALGGDGYSRFNQINILPETLKTTGIPFFKFVEIAFRIISFCNKNKIDIIHSHHRLFDTLVWIIKIFLKTETLMSVQSKVYGKRLLSYKSDILIACAENIKKHLVNYFKIKPEKIKVIHNCIEVTENLPDSISSNLKNELNIFKGSKVIGYFGRFSFREKGLDLLLNVFAELIPEYEDIILLLIGDGPDRKDIYDFQKKYSNSVRLVNPQTDLSKYFGLINIFVLPSRVDPFPLVMLEAGYFGIPFIGTKVDGIAELIKNEETGLLFEKDKTSELKRSIKKLLGDEVYAKKLAANLNNLVIENFSVDKIIPKYFTIYESFTE